MIWDTENAFNNFFDILFEEEQCYEATPKIDKPILKVVIASRQYPFCIRPLSLIGIVILFGCGFITLFLLEKDVDEVVKDVLCVPDHLFMLNRFKDESRHTCKP